MYNMKHNVRAILIITVSLVISLTVIFAGCAKQDTEVPEQQSLPQLVEKLCDGVDVPPYETVTLTETDFEYFTFVPYRDGLTAVAADALVNITPHSLVILHTDEGDGKAIADTMIAKADPNKWLCVGSEAVNVCYTEHYVVLIMSEKVTADAIAENFKAMAKALDGVEMSILTAGNSRYEQ